MKHVKHKAPKAVKMAAFPVATGLMKMLEHPKPDKTSARRGIVGHAKKGKNHPVVTDQKQAVAIKMSEERAEKKHGGKYPEKKDGKKRFESAGRDKEQASRKRFGKKD